MNWLKVTDQLDNGPMAKSLGLSQFQNAKPQSQLSEVPFLSLSTKIQAHETKSMNEAFMQLQKPGSPANQTNQLFSLFDEKEPGILKSQNDY
jgi:hypothetical protein